MIDVRLRRAALVTFAGWAVVVAVVFALPRDVATIVVNALNAIAAGVGAWACLRRASLEPPAGHGWRAVAAGLAILCGYQVYPVAAQIYLGALPSFPSLVDWISIADFPLYGLGLLLWPIAPRQPLERVRTALDGLAFSASIFFMAWIAGLGDVVTSSDLDTASRSLAAMQFTGAALALGL